MKRIAALALLLLLPQMALSQTAVSGNQSGVWTATGSPYLVTGHIVVPSGLTLTIGPGVEVNFQGHYKFTVNGNLQANGSEGQIILFTTENQAVGWGGIRIDSNVICTLTHCRIEYGKTSGGYPDNHGGALALFGADVVATNCVFADNQAFANESGMGGAVYASGTGGAGAPMTRFIDCLFIRNQTYGEGGAIKFTGDMNSVISGCEFIDNNCNYGGGAISFYGVYGTRVENCLFAYNYTMYSNGGAMNTLGFGNVVLIANCTITENTAVTGDGGGINFAYAQAYMVNTIVYDNPGMYSDDVFLDWGSTAEIHYSNLPMPDGASGSHNINANPQFVNPGNLDFTLQEISPCIDAGIDYFSAGGYILVDLDPNEYHGDAPDMGAFEYGSTTDVARANLTTCQLYQNYPNPFSARTAISYQLKTGSQVSLKVFNVMGQEVKTLVSGHRAAGSQSVVWNGLNNSGRSVSPGTYLLKLQAGDEVSSMRVMLMR